MRCRECGAEHAADVRGCPACDADAGEALPVVDLDDSELGIRTEDRYAYVPPGPPRVAARPARCIRRSTPGAYGCSPTRPTGASSRVSSASTASRRPRPPCSVGARPSAALPATA